MRRKGNSGPFVITPFTVYDPAKFIFKTEDVTSMKPGIGQTARRQITWSYDNHTALKFAADVSRIAQFQANDTPSVAIKFPQLPTDPSDFINRPYNADILASLRFFLDMDKDIQQRYRAQQMYLAHGVDEGIIVEREQVFDAAGNPVMGPDGKPRTRIVSSTVVPPEERFKPLLKMDEYGYTANLKMYESKKKNWETGTTAEVATPNYRIVCATDQTEISAGDLTQMLMPFQGARTPSGEHVYRCITAKGWFNVDTNAAVMLPDDAKKMTLPSLRAWVTIGMFSWVMKSEKPHAMGMSMCLNHMEIAPNDFRTKYCSPSIRARFPMLPPGMIDPGEWTGLPWYVDYHNAYCIYQAEHAKGKEQEVNGTNETNKRTHEEAFGVTVNV